LGINRHTTNKQTKLELLVDGAQRKLQELLVDGVPRKCKLHTTNKQTKLELLVDGAQRKLQELLVDGVPRKCKLHTTYQAHPLFLVVRRLPGGVLHMLTLSFALYAGYILHIAYYIN
jgi:hypothetical protein